MVMCWSKWYEVVFLLETNNERHINVSNEYNHSNNSRDTSTYLRNTSAYKMLISRWSKISTFASCELYIVFYKYSVIL